MKIFVVLDVHFEIMSFGRKIEYSQFGVLLVLKELHLVAEGCTVYNSEQNGDWEVGRWVSSIEVVVSNIFSCSPRTLGK